MTALLKTLEIVSWSKRKVPVLPDEVLAEGVMALFIGQLEATGLVDAPCRDQHVVGPKRQRLVALAAGEADALLRPMPRPRADGST